MYVKINIFIKPDKGRCKMKSILIISDGYFHPPSSGIAKIGKLIEKCTSYDVVRVKKLKNIKNTDLSEYSCLILYFHSKQNKNNKNLLKKISLYSKNGGNILAMHGATASFKNNEEYVNLIGGKFTGHAKPSLIHVTGFISFDIIDELYEHNLSEDCEPLLFGNGRPVYWKKKNGNGKVVCFTLGHKRNVYNRNEIMTAIIHAIKYLCGDTHGKN